MPESQKTHFRTLAESKTVSQTATPAGADGDLARDGQRSPAAPRRTNTAQKRNRLMVSSFVSDDLRKRSTPAADLSSAAVEA